MVESKLRHLVVTLERNPHIELPHIWPTSYPSISAEGKPVTQWFIGLIFSKVENLNVDLTYDILTFTETGKLNKFQMQYNLCPQFNHIIIFFLYVILVKNQAVHLNLWKDGMELEAKYVRRKELNQYLPQSILKKKKVFKVFCIIMKTGFLDLLESPKFNSLKILGRRRGTEKTKKVHVRK